MFFLSNNVFAVMINTGVEFLVGNERYTVQHTMDFHTITINSSYIIFNNTGFYISSVNNISTMLICMDGGILDHGDKVVEFDSDTSSGNVTFEISGFIPEVYYLVMKNVQMTTIQSNESGYISFSNDLWSSCNFAIYGLLPNWDINIDSVCNVLDLSLVSNKYNERGAQGWIREDVDNNGEVKVFDFVVVSNNYGKSW